MSCKKYVFKVTYLSDCSYVQKIMKKESANIEEDKRFGITRRVCEKMSYSCIHPNICSLIFILFLGSEMSFC